MADKPARLETMERLLRVIREAALLLVLGFVLYHLGPQLPHIASQLKNAQLAELEIAGMKLKVKEAEVALQAAVKAEAPQKGPEDRQVGEQTKLIVDALQTLHTVAKQAPPISVEPAIGALSSPAESSSFWVYLGARRGGAWVTRYFEIQAVPAADTSIRADADVFKRRHVPAFRDGQWMMGDVLGVLQAGKAVTVRRTQSVPGTENRELWWAEVVSR